MNYFLAGLFLAGGYNVLYYWAYSLGILRHAPLLLNTEISAAFLIGPFFYLYFAAITGTRKFKSSVLLLHSIPSIIAGIIIIILNMKDPSILSGYVHSVSMMPDYTQNKIISGINSICDLSIVTYSAIAGFKTTILLSMKKITREAKIVISYLLLFLLAALILLIASSMNSKVLLIISISILSLLPVYYMIFSFRYPEFAIKVIKEAGNARYRKSISRKHNLTLIDRRLGVLMKEEKIYTDSSLTLRSLSEELLIAPHELSHILNNNYNKNFNSFVNSYRIEESKKLLITSPGKSITEIAYSVGFNTMSSFYNYFLKETNIPPKDYIKMNKTGKE